MEFWRVLLEVFGRDIVVLSSLTFLGNLFKDIDLSLMETFFLGVIGILMVIWVIIPFYDFYKEYKSQTHFKDRIIKELKHHNKND